MAKNFWENDPLAEEASFWKDDPIVEIEAPKVEEPQQSSKFRRYIADPALGLSKGVVGAVEGAVGLADIPTFGAAGKGAEMLEKGVFGGTTKDLQDYLQSLKTPEQIREEQLASEGKGFLGTLKSYAQHPAAIANVIEETLPSMVGGAGIARGAMKLRPGLSAVKAGALGEGAITAGQIAEQTRQQQESGLLNPEQVAISTTAGVLTGVLGNFGGRVAQKLGFNDIDTLLAGGIGQAEKKSVIKSAIQSGLAESTLEELPQSMQEQIAQNINLGRPWDEGVAEAGATGALAGFAMAGVGGGYSQAVQNTRVAERDTRLKQEEVARQRKLESIDAERARIDQIVLDAQNEADIQKAKDEAKKFAVEELNTLGNKAPEKSRIAKSIAAMEVSFNKAIEQGDIDAQKAAIAELTNVPKNIVSLATQPNVITDQTFADMGIGHSATIRRKKELHGLNPQIPSDNVQIRNVLEALLETKEEGSDQYKGIKKYLDSIPTIKELQDEAAVVRGPREGVQVPGQPVAGGLTAGVEGVDGTGLGGITDNVQQLAGREGPRPAALAPEATEVLPSANEMIKNYKGDTLFQFLNKKGGINYSNIAELTGEDKIPNRRGAFSLFRREGGNDIIEMIESGELDEYLPYDAKLQGGSQEFSGQPFDKDPAIEYIQNAFRNNEDVRDYDFETELANVKNQEKEFERQASIPTEEEVNKDIQEIAAEKKGRDILFGPPTASKLAGWTPQRIRNILSYTADPTATARAKGYATLMSPEEFLGLTMTPEYMKQLKETDTIRDKITPLDIEKLAKESQEIFLEVEDVGITNPDRYPTNLFFKVVGHEGRHRMEALRRAGVSKVPVVLYANNGVPTDIRYKTEMSRTKKVKDAILWPQDFGKEGRGTEKAFTDELIPLSWDFKNDLENMAKEADIKFGPAQQLGKRNPIFDKVTNGKELFKAVMKIADTRSDKAIINMLEKVPNLDTVKVITENTSTDPELQGAAGYYDPNTNTIFIDPRVADLSHITLHEIAHAATDVEFDKHVKIVNNVSTPLTPLGKKIVKLFDAFMTESLKKQEGFYAQKNPKEFFMEAYTDDKLKNFLQNRAGVLGLKPAKGKVATLWSDFVNLIKSMFGIPEYAHSMLDEILLLSPELMKGPGAVTTGKEIVQARQAPQQTRPDGSPIKYVESDNDSLWQKTKNAYDSKRKWLDLLGNKIIGNRYSVERKGIDANLPEVDAFRQGRIRGDLINLQATNGQSLAQSGLYRGRLDVRKSGMIIADESTGNRKVGMLDISKAWYELIDRATQDLGSKELAYDMLTAGWYGPRYADLEQYNSTVPKDEQIDISEWTDSDKRTAAEAQRRYGDELKDIRDMRNIQRKDLLDFMVKSGLYTQDKAQKYLDRMDYVALYRVPENEIDQFDTSPIGRSAGLLGAGKEYRLLGSKRAAADPIDNYIQNMSWMMQRGIRNNAAVHTADMLQDIGQGKWFDRPATDLEKKSQNIVTLYVDGKKKDFKVDDLNDMAAFTGSPIVSGFVWDLMKYPVSGLRHGITMMPQFVWNQAWEDPIRATISSGNKAGFAKNIKDTWTSIANNQFKSERTPNADLLNRYGIVGQKDVLDSADVINMYKGKDKSGWKKYVLYLERMAQGSDLGARESIFKNAVDELTKQGYDLETAQDYAAVRAHQYMPYQQVGTSKSLAYLRRMMPFVNPPIQGLARDIAAARGRVGNMTRKQGRNALAWRLAKYAMFTAMYAAFMSGDDEYENQSDEQQDNNFFIGGARIPVPQELKPLKVAIERGTRAWVLNAPKSDMEDGAIAGAVLRKMWEVVAGFAPIPTAFRPLIETKGNYNIFSGLPIVGPGQQRKEPAYQYTDRTSEIARYLGKTLNYSPIKIDHLIKGYGGYMGSTLAQATNYLADDRPEPTINDMLFIGSMLENQQATGSRSDFYNLYDKVTTAKATAKAIINEGDKEGYREYVKEHKGELAIAPAINNLHNQINKLRDSKKLIMRSNRSPEEKRAAIDRLSAAENRVLSSVKKLEAKAIEINER
jgi:hypothetical protein